MSDTDRPMQSAGPYVHYCHCGEWGGHGYASAPGVGIRWWCWEHYPHKRPMGAQAEAAEVADMLGTKIKGSAL